MSSALAIASVTAVLRDLLNNGLVNHDVQATVGSASVSATSPDRIDKDEPSRLNLFLYQVSPNASWRNVGLPSRNGNGERISNPPLALNLHYLLTAYGVADFHAEILLGYGMQMLHETPVLTRNAIRAALAPPGPDNLPLFTSELAEQIEQIKIIPEIPSTEEISRLWSALGAGYRPTAAYQVSVVLIESKQTTKSALPVRARKIYAVPFNQPVIQEIKSQAKPGDPIVSNQPILAGQNLVIAGRGLQADEVGLNIGGIETTPANPDVTDAQIISAIPAQLQAGVQGVQVIHRRLMGRPKVLHRGVESNLEAFVLRPVIDSAQVVFTAGPDVPAISGTLTVTVNPPVGDAQRVVLLLNELVPILDPPVESQSYSFLAPSRIPPGPPVGPPGSSQTMVIPIRGVKGGDYLVRLQVDGAESVLDVANGRFNSPQVTIA